MKTLINFEGNEITVYYMKNRLVSIRFNLDKTFSFFRVRMNDGEIIETRLNVNLACACSSVKHFIGLSGNDEDIVCRRLFALVFNK